MLLVAQARKSTRGLRRIYCGTAELARQENAGFHVGVVDATAIDAAARKENLAPGFDSSEWLDILPGVAWLEPGQRPVRIDPSAGGRSDGTDGMQLLPKDVLGWVKRRSLPSVIRFADYSALEELTQKYGAVVVGLFTSSEAGANRTVFRKAASHFSRHILFSQQCVFAEPEDPEAGRKFLGIGEPGGCIVSPLQGKGCTLVAGPSEVFSLNFHRSRRTRFIAHLETKFLGDSKSLVDFVTKSTSAAVMDFRQFAKDGYDFAVQPIHKYKDHSGASSLFYVTDEDYEGIEGAHILDDRLQSIAMARRAEMRAVYVVPLSNAHWLWGRMSAADLPCVVVTVGEKVYRECGAQLAASNEIESFAVKCAAGKHQTVLLAEPAPVANASDIVETVVHSTFQEIVMDDTADVFVIFHGDDHDEHKLKRIEAVVQAFRETPDHYEDKGVAEGRKVRFAKMNIQRNEFVHRSWPPQLVSLPQVAIFPKHDKQWRHPPAHCDWRTSYVLHKSNNPAYYANNLMKKGSFYPEAKAEADADLSAKTLEMKARNEEFEKEKEAREAADAAKEKERQEQAAEAKAKEEARPKVTRAPIPQIDVEERTLDATAAAAATEEFDFDEL